MITLKIDDRTVKVPENTTVMQAAALAGIDIPSMCFMEGYGNHPSCMVCLVKDRFSGRLFASCAMPVAEGMDLVAGDEEVREARKEALELLLSDHVGDCEAPCRNGCPAFMDIPRMNRLIVEGRFREALVNVKQEIALPLILGYVCEAPCEKVCRREPIDGAVAICQLKRFVAAEDLGGDHRWFPGKKEMNGKQVTIVGAGPAGLAAAFYLTWQGCRCTVIDRNSRPGGSLLRLDETVLPEEALSREVKYLVDYGVEFILDQEVDREYLERTVLPSADAVIFTTGAQGPHRTGKLGVLFDSRGILVDKDTGACDRPGFFAAGSAVRRQHMAIRTVAQGKAVALSVLDHLLGKEHRPFHKMFNSRFGKLHPEEQDEYLKEASRAGRTTPRNGNLEGFDEDEARAEAARCMHCDCRKPSTCKLRLLSEEYGADRKKYLAGERKQVSKQFTHKSIVYEREKCIKCGLCVEIAAGEKELTGLTFIGRGFDVRVGIPFTRELDQALARTALKCAEACPTAAISVKHDKN